MTISWHGLSCFTLTAKTLTGEATLVVNPYQNETGLRFPRTLNADMVAVTHDDEDANNLEAVGPMHEGKSVFVVDMPGEYEVQGTFVYAINAPRKEDKAPHRILRIEMEGVKLAHLGVLNRELTDSELEQLNNIDVLFVPVGGGRVMSPKLATDVIAQVEPRAVVPYMYDIPNVKEKLEDLNAFCKALGVCKREDVTKLKITNRSLPEEDMMIYVLNRE